MTYSEFPVHNPAEIARQREQEAVDARLRVEQLREAAAQARKAADQVNNKIRQIAAANTVQETGDQDGVNQRLHQLAKQSTSTVNTAPMTPERQAANDRIRAMWRRNSFTMKPDDLFGR